MKEKKGITPVPPERIFPRGIEDEMKSSYIDYAMSVIVGRALPDVRDGLKPVHRRILYTMKEMSLHWRTAFKKSARVVGDVLGKYHPHGDMAVYDALVRMVQDFSLRYPLVAGQGNFGSIDGDPPAAMRYTEVRLQQLTEEMLADLDKETVDFTPNYDGSLTEPKVLPALLPNLLVNGSSGIAVGMATNVPPHNLGEVVDALIAYCDDPEITDETLLKIIKGPDFPTAGIINGRQGIKDYFRTGRGSLKVRAKAEIEEIRSGREAIIIEELPYQVNKAVLIETIAGLVREHKLDDIADIRDESDREGIRIVIEIKREGNAQVVLNQLFKHTQMEITFGVIMLALVSNRPRVLNMREMLHYYLEYRKEVVVRRTRFELARAEARAHILEGLRIALEHLNQVIKIIRESASPETARLALEKNLKLSSRQAQAILDMRLQQLTALERKKLEEEYLELIKTIATLRSILADPKKVIAVIKGELSELKKKYADDRRTRIVAQTADLSIDDLIPEEDVVVTFTHAGYVKRLPLTAYRSQRRGGKGVTGVTTREEDFAEEIFVTSSHAYLLLFTSRGRVYWLRTYQIPEASRIARGKAIVNLLRLSSPDEKITTTIPISSFTEEQGFLVMATEQGVVKRISLTEFDNPRPSGIIALGLASDDKLVTVRYGKGDEEVMLGTRQGMAIRFPVGHIRLMGRTARGVRGVRLAKEDAVVGMGLVNPKDSLLTVSVQGYGKRTRVGEYRLQSRGGKGVRNIKTTTRNGLVVGIRKVGVDDELMLLTEKGMMIRLPVKGISMIGRNVQGVRLVRLEAGDKVASIAHIAAEEDADKEKQPGPDN